MPEQPRAILVLDDDDSMRLAVARQIRLHGHDVETFSRADEVLDYLKSADADCLVADLAMPGMTGLELQEAIEASGYSLSIVFLTGHGNVQSAVKALQKGAVDFLEKTSRTGGPLVGNRERHRNRSTAIARADREPNSLVEARNADGTSTCGPESGRPGKSEQADRPRIGDHRTHGEGPPSAGHGEAGGPEHRRPRPLRSTDCQTAKKTRQITPWAFVRSGIGARFSDPILRQRRVQLGNQRIKFYGFRQACPAGLSFSLLAQRFIIRRGNEDDRRRLSALGQPRVDGQSRRRPQHQVDQQAGIRPEGGGEWRGRLWKRRSTHRNPQPEGAL